MALLSKGAGRVLNKFRVRLFRALLGKGGHFPMEIKENTSLAPHTVYKIGGPAYFWAEVRTPEELIAALSFAKEKNVDFFVLGAGSNILVSDRGYPGLIIHLADDKVEISGTKVKVGAAVMMASVVAKTAQADLGGFEWAIGIPGTFGGSVRGNAGCFGGEVKDVVESVDVFDSKKVTSYALPATSCEFGYRDSIFKRHPEWIILSATLALKKGNPDEIQKKIKEITLERTKKQDIGTKSCGCIFKNVSWGRRDINREQLISRFPELLQFKERSNIPASFLIDAAGLKGGQVGKVFVSPRHANYLVNQGGATAEEVVMLIAIVKDTVRRKFGIILEEEIQYVGL